LKVDGNPADGLTWTVSAMDRSTDFWRRITELNALPEVQVIEARSSGSTAVDSKADVESTAVDSEDGSSERLRYLEGALRTLGFSALEAKRRLERAWESLGARAGGTSDEELVKTALRLRAA
jgi:hypothetical protein